MTAPDPDIAGDLVQSPVPIWLVIIIGAAVMLATAVPKVFGPLSQAWSKWLEDRRDRMQSKDDYDISERDRALAYLQGIVDALHKERVERDQLIEIHRQWDYRRLAERPAPADDPMPGLYPIRTTPVDVALDAALNEEQD